MSDEMFLFEPCPFCGSKELKGWQADEDNYMIECQNCIVEFKFPYHVKGSAAELWNDRKKVEYQTVNDVLDAFTSWLEEYRQNPLDHNET